MPTVFRLKHPEPSETQVLAWVLMTLSYQKSVARFWRQNTGAGQLMRKGKLSQYIEFGFPGSPDVHGFMADGRALYIEVKRPSGKLEPEQRQFLEQARAAGCVAFVARNVDDVLRGLEEAGAKP